MDLAIQKYAAVMSMLQSLQDVAFKPYREDFVEKMIAYFEESEEFEKCAKLVDFKRSRFDHEKNYESR